MQVQAIKSRVIQANDDLFAVIDQAINADSNLKGHLPENSVLAISSKIISYCQGRLVKKEANSKEQKHALVRKEAELYTDPNSSKFDLMLSIKNSTLIVNAGIDESNASLNGEGCFVLWPEKIQETLNAVWKYLRNKHGLKNFGVITTDSRSFPLRWGVVGTAIASCGFKSLNNHIGQKDIFGREMVMEQVNVAEALGVAATFEMGEVAEQTPFVLVSDLKKVQFLDHEPSKEELENSKIDLKDDLYAPLLIGVDWQKGNG
ncbi:MAG: polymerase III beta clamp subunit protein [Candidatus Pacebacteria bacterium GW2011_GWF2_38_9]|nr:MAG: polymerase III beta clamp subunit protein [candidate division TM6 bacterium GW2011_GWF2_28_16]KKQ08089.1 MAG: polymerase III beta clamp subunit protein [Candidatus Pacebacteria bacterium GW2011_GWF1_36_5]KKQ89149.1 MAG: polymerase III beta clamp subunit protein [Candidatus Pacebacteria bacterium GW2011_GWF2_38_9]